ncbi:MAG TPA: hypothetical protein VIT93_05865 [Dehalococcoidia bacterium]
MQTDRTIEALVWITRLEPALVIMAEDTDIEPEDAVKIMRLMTLSPLLVIGERDMSAEIDSLSAGGDFYLRRPFTAAELLLRTRTLLRGSMGLAGGSCEAEQRITNGRCELTIVRGTHPESARAASSENRKRGGQTVYGSIA